MDNQDWSHLGDEIKDAVQSAIDTKDFTRLNESIGRTVNQALDRFEQVLDGDGTRSGTASSDKSSSQEESSNWYNHGTSWGKGQVQRQRERSLLKPKSKDPFILYKDRYASPVSSKVFGILCSVLGWTLTLGCGIAEFVMLLVGITIFNGDFPVGVPLAMGIVLPFLLSGIWMAGKGQKVLGLLRRYKKYVGFLGDKEYCELQDLQYANGGSPKKLEKDLDTMLEKGWFLQGHLDQQRTSLIVTDQAYGQYMEAQKEFRRREQEIKHQEQNTASHAADFRANEEPSREIPEEVRNVIEEGRGYLRQIRESNDAIPGEEISAKISRLEVVIERIFNRVEQHPDLVEELRRFMKYYLPTTVKLLKAYEELDRQEVQGPNIVKSKGEIEDTLDTINQAFENLLDSFFEDTAVDISSDISVMQTLMAQEGLLGGKLKEQMKDL